MMKHNFILAPVDTDSISFCKPDMTPFTKDEQIFLLNEINELMPELIKFDHDGYYEKVIVIKAKNYILYNEGKIKTKGSAIRDQKKELALREMLEQMIWSLINDKPEELIKIYNNYIIESQNIKDINRWATKKTITEAVFTSERLNETKVLDAIKDEEGLQQGDKIWVYPAISIGPIIYHANKNRRLDTKHLQLTKNWTGNEDKDHYLKRIYDTVKILENIIDISQFPNYNLKKNKLLLENLLKDSK